MENLLKEGDIMKKVLISLIAVLAVFSFAFAPENEGLLPFIWKNLETVNISGTATAFDAHDGRLLVEITTDKGKVYSLLPVDIISKNELRIELGSDITVTGKKIPSGEMIMIIPEKMEINGEKIPAFRKPVGKEEALRFRNKGVMPPHRSRHPEFGKNVAWLARLIWNNLQDVSVVGKAAAVVERGGKFFLKVSSSDGDVYTIFPLRLLALKGFEIDEKSQVQVSGKKLVSGDIAFILPERITINGKAYDIKQMIGRLIRDREKRKIQGGRFGNETVPRKPLERMRSPLEGRRAPTPPRPGF